MSTTQTFGVSLSHRTENKKIAITQVYFINNLKCGKVEADTGPPETL